MGIIPRVKVYSAEGGLLCSAWHIAWLIKYELNEKKQYLKIATDSMAEILVSVIH